MNKPRHRNRSWTTALVLSVTLAAGAVPAPAHAVPPIIAAGGVIVSTLGTIWNLYGTFRSILTMLGIIGSGPDIAQQIAAMEQAILNELRQMRDQTWTGSAKTVLDQFQIIATWNASDPALPAAWNSTWSTAGSVIQAFDSTIVAANDPTSSYELAPAFAALVTVYYGLAKMKSEWDSAYPSTWATYQVYGQIAMQDYYDLVGMRYGICQNAGAEPAFNVYLNGQDAAQFGTRMTNTQVSSQLYSVVANHMISTGRKACYGLQSFRTGGIRFTTPVAYGATCSGFCADCAVAGEMCNPVTNQCHADAQSYILYSPNQESWLAAVNHADLTYFGADPTVNIIRASIGNLIGVVGGTDPGSDAWVPTDAELIDPWVLDHNCPAVSPYGNSRTYAIPRVYSWIPPGSPFFAGESVSSSDGRFTLWMQLDGNLVLYMGSTALWSTGTQANVGTNPSGATTWMQSDGNLVVHASDGRALWASNTAGHSNAYLVVQNDGNVVMTTLGGPPIWATNTCCH
jgi:hypothetical protein